MLLCFNQKCSVSLSRPILYWYWMPAFTKGKEWQWKHKNTLNFWLEPYCFDIQLTPLEIPSEFQMWWELCQFFPYDLKTDKADWMWDPWRRQKSFYLSVFHNFIIYFKISFSRWNIWSFSFYFILKSLVLNVGWLEISYLVSLYLNSTVWV